MREIKSLRVTDGLYALLSPFLHHLSPMPPPTVEEGVK